MQVMITHLKCNAWPEGAKVGDIVDIQGAGENEDQLPTWAQGKCVRQGDAPTAEQQHVAAALKAADGEPMGDDERRAAKAMLAEAERGLNEVTGRLEAMTRERDAAKNDLAVVSADRDRLKSELDAAAARIAAYDACKNADDLKALRKA